MSQNCILCGHHLQAQIEAQYTRGTISANDVVAQFGSDTIDILGVMVHFEDHELALEKEASEKRKVLEQFQDTPDVSLENKEHVLEPSSKTLPKTGDDIDTLENLYRMFMLLEEKLVQVALSKSATGLSAVTREMRETLKEIDRVKKDKKASMADRTDELLAEHREQNRFLLHNLCNGCAEKYMAFLRGEFETFAVDAHGRQDGSEPRADAVDSGPVE